MLAFSACCPAGSLRRPSLPFVAGQSLAGASWLRAGLRTTSHTRFSPIPTSASWRWPHAPPNGPRRSRLATASTVATVRTNNSCTIPTVQIVYVAAPHSEHLPLGLQAIAAGKHVLIEKPLALSAHEAEQITAAATSSGVLAAEAMWTRYLPQFDVLHTILERGDLGIIRLATADVGWQMGPDAPPRFFDPAQGGGAALDMGVYGYWFAQSPSAGLRGCERWAA